MPSSNSRLAGPVEGRVVAGALGDRAGRGHAEALLEEPAVGVAVDVAWRLVGAGEPRPDHHVGGAGGEGQRHVARVPYPAVGPHVRAELAGSGRALEYGGELRPADAGHHAGRAHGAGPDADLDDVGARLDQVAYAVGRDHVARDDRNAGGERADRSQGLEHLVLVAVRGVEDQHVGAGLDQGRRLGGDVAVDADRSGDAQPAGRHRARDGRGRRAVLRYG